MAPIPKTGLGAVGTPVAPAKTAKAEAPAAPLLDKPVLPAPPKRLPSTRFDTSKKPPLALNKSMRFKTTLPVNQELKEGLKLPAFGGQMSAGPKNAKIDLKAGTPEAATTASPASKGFGQKSASGKVSAEQWADPTKLVGNLTQYPATGKTPQSQAACSAANLIGAAFLSGGPDAAAKVMKNVAQGGSQLTADEKTQLSAIADKVANKTATFEDLNKAQELMYRSANYKASALDTVAMAQESPKLSKAEKKELATLVQRYSEAEVMGKDPADEAKINKLLTKAFGVPTEFGLDSLPVEANRHATDSSGLSDDELESMGRTAAGSTSKPLVPGEDIKNLANKIKPGESLTLRVAGDRTHADPDHYVTIGRRPNGQMYIYNPDPGKGDSTLVVGGKTPDKAFNEQLERYQLRLKPDVVTHAHAATERLQPPALQTQW